MRKMAKLHISRSVQLWCGDHRAGLCQLSVGLKIHAESSSNGSSQPASHNTGKPRPELRDASAIPCVMMNQGTERAVVNFVMDAVTGAHHTPGRHKTGGVPPKPPATVLLSLLPSVFWDFGSLYQRRCGVILASCCGSGKLSERRCGVLAADTCGSGKPSKYDVAASKS